MAAVISGVAFCNNDLSPSVQEKIVTQLFIDYVLTGAEFDAKVVADPLYVSKVKIFNLRVLVIRTYAQNDIANNIPNRELADVVLFVKSGLANVVTKSGHGPTVPVLNMHWGQFGLY